LPVIRSVQKLELLPTDPDVNGLLRRDRILFELADLERLDQIRWTTELNRYQSRCGCPTGAACLLLTLMGGFYLLLTRQAIFSLEFLGGAILVFSTAVIVGLLGKIIALEITCIQFSCACRRLRNEIVARQQHAAASRLET
jgi:hypothetical protein